MLRLYCVLYSVPPSVFSTCILYLLLYPGLCCIPWQAQALCDALVDGYCSTVQGLLDWFEVDWYAQSTSTLWCSECVVFFSALFIVCNTAFCIAFLSVSCVNPCVSRTLLHALFAACLVVVTFSTLYRALCYAQTLFHTVDCVMPGLCCIHSSVFSTPCCISDLVILYFRLCWILYSTSDLAFCTSILYLLSSYGCRLSFYTSAYLALCYGASGGSIPCFENDFQGK